MCAYFIFYQTEFIKRRNKLRCGELDRSIVINKRKYMKRISQHFGGPSNFSRYRKERYMGSLVWLIRSDHYLVLWSK